MPQMLPRQLTYFNYSLKYSINKIMLIVTHDIGYEKNRLILFGILGKNGSFPIYEFCTLLYHNPVQSGN